VSATLFQLQILPAYYTQVLDVMLVLRVLRIVKIFHGLERFKTVLATIVNILPSMLTYAGVLAVVFYMFAVVGMEAFAGRVRFFGANPTQEDQLFCGNERLRNSTFYQASIQSWNF
jgi:two pore calcium channel protein 3